MRHVFSNISKKFSPSRSLQ